MVSYKLSRLEDLPTAPRRTLTVKLMDALLVLLVLCIMGTAIYVGTKAVLHHTSANCDHMSYLAGRCHE